MGVNVVQMCVYVWMCFTCAWEVCDITSAFSIRSCTVSVMLNVDTAVPSW